jgi:hypothetical protein
MAATARTRIKARLLPRWPSSITAGDLIRVDSSGGTREINFTMTDLAANAAPASTFRFLGQNGSGGSYEYVAQSALLGSISITLSQISDMSANARTFNAAANYSAMRTALGVAIGTDVQAFDADLSALAGLTSAADKLPYFTGSATAAVTDFTAFARTILDDANAGAVRTTIGAGTGNGTIGGSLGSTDNLAMRADGTGGVTAQGSALVIADTTGALSRSGNGGIPVQGTNANDNAAAGDYGEYIESEVLSGSAVSLSTGAAKTVTSISLTAGDWDVEGNVVFSPAGTLSFASTGSNTTTDALPTLPNKGGYAANGGSTTGGHTLAFGRRRYSLSGTTTIYLIAFGTFTSTCTAYGAISGRRVR